jgi:hypothetical protein
MTVSRSSASWWVVAGLRHDERIAGIARHTSTTAGLAGHRLDRVHLEAVTPVVAA